MEYGPHISILTYLSDTLNHLISLQLFRYNFRYKMNYLNYLVIMIIFCKFAAEMVALPSKSGGVKEHQKGMR